MEREAMEKRYIRKRIKICCVYIYKHIWSKSFIIVTLYGNKSSSVNIIELWKLKKQMSEFFLAGFLIAVVEEKIEWDLVLVTNNFPVFYCNFAMCVCASEIVFLCCNLVTYKLFLVVFYTLLWYIIYGESKLFRKFLRTIHRNILLNSMCSCTIFIDEINFQC